MSCAHILPFKIGDMEGGVRIGSGTYGCVYDPPLLCKSAVQRRRLEQKMKTGRWIGKLSEAGDVDTERRAAIRLRTIPNATHYFAYADPDTVCIPLDAAKQPNVADIETCEYVERKGYEEALHFSMPWGGLTIHRETPIPKSPSSPFRFAAYTKHLLEGCALMTLANFVHYDLYSSNCLLDPVTKLPRIIDFGMSFYVEKINTETLNYRWKQYIPNKSTHEPPEIVLINGIKHDLPLAQVKRDFVRYYRTAHDISRIIGTPALTLLQDLFRFWRTSAAGQAQDWVAFFKLYWPGFDSWGAGFILMQWVRRFMTSATEQESTDWETAAPRVKEVLKGLLQFDPTQRYDSVEALSVFDPENAILKSAAGVSWLSGRKKVRAALLAAEL